MEFHYPAAFATLQAWATENRFSSDDARVRFAQYAILRAIATSNALRPVLVFKGGNALDFVWQANRSTRDLDFSADASAQSFSPESLQTHLTPALRSSTQLLGVLLKIHRIEQQPPGSTKTFITYTINIGYALPDETKLRERVEKGRPSPNVVPVDISINEPICEDRYIKIDDSHELRVSTIEDIIAEKLRALLQQPIRNRRRRQDLLDIAVTLQSHPGIDRRNVAQFLLTKAEARNVHVSRSAFHEPGVTQRAKQDYEELRADARDVFVPFDAALEALNTFVDELNIPDA